MKNAPYVFADTSAWFSLADSGDKDHEQAVRFVETQPSLVTTNFVIDETITLVLRHLGYWPARRIGERLWSGKAAHIIWVSIADQREAWELFKRYSDKAFSFTDCTSFVVMERLGIQHAFAFNKHFEQIGRFIRLP